MGTAAAVGFQLGRGKSFSSCLHPGRSCWAFPDHAPAKPYSVSAVGFSVCDRKIVNPAPLTSALGNQALSHHFSPLLM